MPNPFLETLEVRILPAISFSLAGGALHLVGQGNEPHSVLVRPAPVGIEVLADNQVISLAVAPAQIHFASGPGRDSFVNRTAIGGTLSLGEGDNLVNSQAASVLTAGNGNNLIQLLAGGSMITVGDGANNIYGGPGDTISVGAGPNLVYDILPGNTTVSVRPHAGVVNYLFVGPDTSLIGAEPQDLAARFFTPGRTIGSGTLVLDQGTLYFTASNAGDTYVANDFGEMVQVVTISGGVLAVNYFPRKEVRLIANFGGAGRDTFINNTSLPDVQYGAGGQNFLLGGTGPLNLLKAGGAADNSVAIGRSPVLNDLGGSGRPGTTTVLAAPPGSRTIFRTNSTQDVLVGQDAATLVLSLFLEQRR